MATNLEDVIEMIKRIIQEVDYDIYKEILAEEEDGSLDPFISIVEYYIKVNP